MALNLIQIDGFPETSALLNWLVTAGSDGEGKKISIDNVKAELGIDALMQFGGAIVPVSTPEPTGDLFWIATEEGTYTNFGGVVVPANSIAIISRVDGVFTSSITEIQPQDLSGLLPKSDIGQASQSNNHFDKSNYRPDTIVASTGETSTSSGNETTMDVFIPDNVTHVTASGLHSGFNHRMAYLDENLSPITPTTLFSSSSSTTEKPSGAKYFRLWYQVGSDPDNTTKDTLMVNWGEEALPYEPFQGAVVSISGVPIRNADIDVYSKSEVDAILPNIEHENVGINLVDVSSMLANGLVSSTNGQINTHPDWRIIWKVPVADLEGILYALGWNTSRGEYAFYSGAIPTESEPSSNYLSSVVSFGIASKSGGQSGIPIPPSNATWAAITVKNATESESVFENIQLSRTYQDEYFPFMENDLVVKRINDSPLAANGLIDGDGVYHRTDEILQNSGGNANGIQLEILPDGGAQMSYNLAGKSIREVVAPFRALSFDSSNVFDWRQTFINGALFRSTNDDAAPYRILGTTIAANHGYYKSVVTANGHGKQNVDVGSVWTDGTYEHVLSNVKSVNVIEFISRYDGDPQFSGATLTHVSGGTNTGTVTASATSTVQSYPVIRDRSLRVFADGNILNGISEGDTFSAKETISFEENYQIISKPDLIDWLIGQVGTTTKITQFLGDPSLHVRITYVFNKYGGCTIYSEITNISDASVALQDIMFVMANPPVAPYQYYVPTSLPLTFESNNYDFTDLTTLPSMGSRLNFNSDSLKNTGLYGDNLMMVKDSAGIALGFLPVLDTAIANRRDNASRKALQISNSKKVYMSGIDSASINSIASGESYATVAYKNTFVREGMKTAYFIVPTNNAVYVYSYWHEFGIDTVEVPEECFGKQYEVVEKTDNVTVLSKSVTSNILVDVANTDNQGYVIFKFNR